MNTEQQRVGAPQRRPQAQGSRDFLAILTVLVSFVAISTMIVILSSFKNCLSILHQVPEGHVGVYWRGGDLLKIITNPGFHLKIPLVTQYEFVQVTLKTDEVRDVPCLTKEGFMINFGKIKVISRLRKDYVYETLLSYGVDYDKTLFYEKICHEINQFCSSHSLEEVYIDMFNQIGEKMKDALQGDCTRYAPGIEIISVYVTTPTIPDSIRLDFERKEEDRLEVLLAVENQKVLEIEAETREKIAIIEAEKNDIVNKILMEQELRENDYFRRHQEIENQIYIAREESRAYADSYREKKKAEAKKLKLTSEFLELELIEDIADNTTNFFEDKVSKMLLGNFLEWVSRNLSKEVSEERLLGDLLQRVSRNLLKEVCNEGNSNLSLSFNESVLLFYPHDVMIR